MADLPVGLRDRCSIYLPHPICYKSYEVIMEGIDRRMGKWSYHLTIVELGRKPVEELGQQFRWDRLETVAADV